MACLRNNSLHSKGKSVCGHHRPKRKQIPVTAVGRGAEQTFNTDTHVPRFAKKENSYFRALSPRVDALPCRREKEERRVRTHTHTRSLAHKVDAPAAGWMHMSGSPGGHCHRRETTHSSPFFRKKGWYIPGHGQKSRGSEFCTL